ncbi:MAG: hypothetical protein NVS2B7_13130 [Herpetosiphon sp.]
MSTNYDSRVTAYFGDLVLSAGFMVTPHLLLRHFRALGLAPEHVVLLQLLMETTWDLAEPPDTMQKLAERMGVSVRTVQRYSEHLVAQRLVVVYDQFSQGAQIGNSYDLSPLFKRLAHFAPSESVRRVTTERRVRGIPRACHPTPSVSLPDDIADTRPGDTHDTPRSDTIDTPVATPVSDLKGTIKKLPKKEKNQNRQWELLPAAEGTLLIPENAQKVTGPSAGYSLRWNQSLSAAEVAETDALLKRMDVGNPLRSVLALTLAPAETWALWAYSRAKSWSTGLMISQLYDRATKQVRPAAELSPEHDAVGQLLVGLPSSTAEALLSLVIERWPQRPRDLCNEPLLQDAPDALRTAADGLWTMITTIRMHHNHPPQPSLAGIQPLAPSPSSSSFPVISISDAHAAAWQQVRDDLAAKLTCNDWETWIKPSTLLELDQTTAVVGTPNVFVRQEVEQRYCQHLETAFAVVLGYPVQVQAVIGSPADLRAGSW